MRADISLTLRCFDCGSDLEVCSKSSGFNYNSASHANASFVVKPCETCKRKYTSPLILLKQAIDECNSIVNNE